MEFDRDLAIQVGITVAVVAVFVVGLAALSGVYGEDVPIEDESLEGSIDGQYTGDVADGTVEFHGTFDNDIEATLDGTITGTVENGTLERGNFEGTISGAIDGNVTGTVTDATVDEDTRTIEGEFEGTATDGTTGIDLTPDGGLVLIGLMAAFIVLMPAFGYLIMRLESDDE